MLWEKVGLTAKKGKYISVVLTIQSLEHVNAYRAGTHTRERHRRGYGFRNMYISQHMQHGSSTPTPESAVDSKSTILPSAARREESLLSFAVGATINLFQQFVGFIMGIKMSLSFSTLFGGLNTILC